MILEVSLSLYSLISTTFLHEKIQTCGINVSQHSLAHYYMKPKREDDTKQEDSSPTHFTCIFLRRLVTKLLFNGVFEN